MDFIEGRGRKDGREPADGRFRAQYVKPVLATHGSVQQLTEGGHHSGRDSGSNIKFRPLGDKILDW